MRARRALVVAGLALAAGLDASAQRVGVCPPDVEPASDGQLGLHSSGAVIFGDLGWHRIFKEPAGSTDVSGHSAPIPEFRSDESLLKRER